MRRAPLRSPIFRNVSARLRSFCSSDEPNALAISAGSRPTVVLVPSRIGGWLLGAELPSRRASTGSDGLRDSSLCTDPAASRAKVRSRSIASERCSVTSACCRANLFGNRNFSRREWKSVKRTRTAAAAPAKLSHLPRHPFLRRTRRKSSLSRSLLTSVTAASSSSVDLLHRRPSSLIFPPLEEFLEEVVAVHICLRPELVEKSSEVVSIGRSCCRRFFVLVEPFLGRRETLPARYLCTQVHLSPLRMARGSKESVELGEERLDKARDALVAIRVRRPIVSAQDRSN